MQERRRMRALSPSVITQCRRRQSDQQHRQGEDRPRATVIAPTDVDALVCQHMLPRQRGQRGDGGDLGAQDAAEMTLA